MHKITKKLLISIMALGLMAPVAISNVTPHTTVQARTRWHKGLPSHTIGSWLSNMQRHRIKRGLYIGKNGKIEYSDIKFKRNGKPLYNSSGLPGDNHGATYKYLGRGKYKIITHHGAGAHWILRKHGRHFSLYCDSDYLGYFHRISNRTANRL